MLRSKNSKLETLDVLTLSERDSKGLKKFYSSVQEVEFKDINDLNYSMRPRLNTNEIHKRFLNGEDVELYYSMLVENTFDNFLETCTNISGKILDYIIGTKKSYDVILSPVGLCHPFHIATRKGIELSKTHMETTFNPDYFDTPDIIYYVDKPYYQHRYVKEMYESFKDQIIHNNYIEVHSPEVYKEVEILDVFKNVYPTELGMMRFSRDILTKESDIFLVPNIILDKFKEILQ